MQKQQFKLQCRCKRVMQYLFSEVLSNNTIATAESKRFDNVGIGIHWRYAPCNSCYIQISGQMEIQAGIHTVPQSLVYIKASYLLNYTENVADNIEKGDKTCYL